MVIKPHGGWGGGSDFLVAANLGASYILFIRLLLIQLGQVPSAEVEIKGN